MSGSPMCDSGETHSCPAGAGAPRLCAVAGRSLPVWANINTPPPPPGRLSSLRSRDLTLGGFKKKAFVPNLHSVRKTKDDLKEETHPVPKMKRDRETRQRESRGRRRERPPTIQSHSIFEQGPADSMWKTGNWDRTEQDDRGLSPVVKYIKKEKLTPDKDDEILQKLQRDDFLDDPNLKNDSRNMPIQLPLHTSCDAFAHSDRASFKMASKPGPRPTSLRREALSPQQPSIAQVFQQLSLSDQEALLLIQLPDSMPGRPVVLQEKVPKKEGKVKGKQLPHIKAHVAKESVPVLSDFSEGFIGKLQIRKSGKVQLVLGEVTMDVSEGAAFSFLQQLVSVRVSEGLTGEMCVLGNVKHKLVCSPNFEALLEDAKYSSHENSGNSVL